MTETLATKSDVASLRGDLEKTEASLRAEPGALRGDLGRTKAKLQGQMHELEQRMTIRLGAMMVGAVAPIVALIKLV